MTAKFRIELVTDCGYELMATAPSQEIADDLRDFYANTCAADLGYVTVRIIQKTLTTHPEPG